MQDVVTNHLDLWSSAVRIKASAGRGSENGKYEAYGIKKLRELILELAVRGRLVGHAPEDEPAKELLKRVRSERLQLVRQGKFERDKNVPAISESEIPFELPQNWEWERIGNIGHDWGQKTPDGDFTYIDVSAIDNNVGLIKSPNVLSAAQAPSRARKIVSKGTVIYSTVRPYLKNISVVNEDYFPEPIASTAFAVLHPFEGMPGDFFALYFRSPTFVKYVESVQTGIAYPAINDKQFYGGLVPIPPLAEQHRIVAKVDELMALCDTLEQQQLNSVEAHQVLVETLLVALTRVTSHQELAEAWARVAESFDALFTTEHSIDQLKQTILQLAVMGKLVPQSPLDEPASEFLNKVAAEKECLVRTGELAKHKPSPRISVDEQPFQLPESWCWARVWDVAKLITSGSRDWAKYYSQTGAIFVTMGNLSRGDYKLRMDSIRFVRPPADGEGSRTRLEENDLLISITGDVGNLGLVPRNFGEAYINQHTCLLRFMPDCQSRYFPELMRSRFAKCQFDAPQRGIKNSFRLSDVGEMVVPVPPLAEQHRIVSKIDELMALCDSLKVRLSEAEATQLHLADAVVAQVVSEVADAGDALAA